MPESDLALLTGAAQEAAKIALDYWKSDQKIHDKGDGAGPVSEGDLAVDRFLRETLLAARPGYGWLSEETEDDLRRLDSRRAFVVDPIDGTRSYIDHGRTWAHSLAVVDKGRPVAAVVLMPARGKLYAAAEGQGAFLNGAPIRAAIRKNPDGASILAPRPHLDAKHWPGGLPALERHFRPSLAYRMCLVAEGRFDAMLTLRDAWEWDIAAGALIAEEAGARATDRVGKPLAFNSRGGKTPGVLVAPPWLHKNLIRRLK